MISYKDSGVDIEKGDLFVELIKTKVKSTHDSRVKAGVGGFASLYSMGQDRFLAAGTDGVGTKLLLANQLNKHDTIGIDLVAMCANDILCTGAKPLFFLDYLATSKLDPRKHSAVVEGIVEGCQQAELALIGGETAEMPGVYQQEDYDLAGFAVGEVNGSDIIGGNKVKPGDTLIALSSSGPHSNGYSLIRKLFNKSDTQYLKHALTPTRMYWKVVKELFNKQLVSGISHITGGGFSNIPRMNPDYEYSIPKAPEITENQELWDAIRKLSGLPDSELYQTFNMGVGLVIATSNPRHVIETVAKVQQTKQFSFLNQMTVQTVGEVKAGIPNQVSGFLTKKK